MTLKELTDMCCMELSANGSSHDLRNVYHSCERISKKRGCSDTMFAKAWYNAISWFSAFSSQPADKAACA